MESNRFTQYNNSSNNFPSYNPAYSYDYTRQTSTPPSNQSFNYSYQSELSNSYSSYASNISFSSVGSSPVQVSNTSPISNIQAYPYYNYYNYTNYYDYSYQNHSNYDFSYSNYYQNPIQNASFQYSQLNDVDSKQPQANKQQTTPCKNIINQLLEGEDENQSDESKKSRRRFRTQFTMEQRRYLLSIFERTIYPSKEVLEQVSKELKVTIPILQTWFKNTRSKQKKLTHTRNL